MVGTVLSLVFAIFFGLHALEAPWQPPFGSPFFLVTSLSFLLVAFMGSAMAWKNATRTQMKVMGCAQELFLKDRKLYMCLSYLFALCLFSLYITFVVPSGTSFGATFPFYLWLLAFGFGFDVLRFYLNRSFQYSYTPFLITMLARDLEKAVQNKEEAKAFEWLEVVIDTCIKATHKNQIRLASSSLNAVQILIETYVQEVSRVGMMQSFQQEGSGLTFLDKVNSLCIFVSERLMWVFEVAIKEHNAPIAENIISEFGKMSVFFARHNPLVATIPISFLAKCAQIAKDASQDELLTRIALTLSETSKLLLAYTKERNESFRDLILTTIAALEQVVKMIFKQNRDINVALLMQPFAEIGEFIGSDQMRTFPDRDEVIKEIRRVLTEFQALQVVTKNIETMGPALAEDSSSSYQQDMP